MSEKKEDLNTNQSVAGADLNNTQTVTEQDLPASGQGEKLADGTDENKTVPYSEMKKAIDEKNAAMEREKLLQSQINMVQANQPVQQVQTQTQPLSDYDQAKADLGLAGEEYIDEGQRSLIHARMTEIINVKSQQNNAVFSNQQFEINHPDFSSVVGLRNPLNGQITPSAEISKILMEKPYLTAAAYASSQGAYEIVLAERQLNKLQQQNTVNQEHLKQQGIEDKLAPVSGSAAAGGAISNKTQASISIEQQRENERKIAAGELA